MKTSDIQKKKENKLQRNKVSMEEKEEVKMGRESKKRKKGKREKKAEK